MDAHRLLDDVARGRRRVRQHALRAILVASASTLTVAAAGCADREQTAAPRSDTTERVESKGEGALLPVSLPEVSRLETSVQTQVREQYAVLQRLQEAPGTPATELGRAYGAMGTLLMAAEYIELAEPYYLNARALAPGEYRWPYYLGHLYKTRGMLPQAVAFFEEVLTLRPDDVATLVWLGEMHLTRGRPDAADPLFAKALTLQPQSVAARFGLGRAALAKRDHRGAVEHLEAALTLNKQAVNIHYPLAMAYRGLGESAKAEAHLAQQGKFEILPTDPLIQELRALLQSAISYEIAGTRELNSGHVADAAAQFRKGLELEPSNASLRHKLGTALYMLGQADAARETFERVVRESPEYAKAHYSLGVLLESSGRRSEAIERYSAAVRHEPEYLEARARLAGLLRLQGRLREALAHYDHVLMVDPRVPEASFGSAMVLVRLQQYQEARERLTVARQVHLDQPGFAHALARVLAAAPEARIRDGRQALALMQSLSEEQRRLDMGETMAMVLAEVGQYEQAAAWQRDAIAAARRVGNEGLARRMTGSLQLYEAGQPCRTPWRDEDLP
jgi:tetratricopeptide (TPR) repeat protein